MNAKHLEGKKGKIIEWHHQIQRQKSLFKPRFMMYHLNDLNERSEFQPTICFVTSSREKFNSDFSSLFFRLILSSVCIHYLDNNNDMEPLSLTDYNLLSNIRWYLLDSSSDFEIVLGTKRERQETEIKLFFLVCYKSFKKNVKNKEE